MALKPISIREMEKQTGDQYEAVVVMSKRAKQVLKNRIAENLMSATEEDVEMGVYDEVIEKNPDDYEELEKPTSIAVNDFIKGKLKWDETQDS